MTKRVALLVVVALIVAACGSTVPTVQQQAAEEAAVGGVAIDNNGVGTDGSLDSSGDLGSSGVAGSTSGSGSAIGGAGGTTVGGSSVSGTSTGGGGGSSAPGVSSEKISLGIPIVVGGTVGNQSIGAGAASGIDSERGWKALIEDINKRGGIAGHEVEPVYHKVDLVSNKSSQQQSEEACADWTQDHKILAAMVGDTAEETIFACLEKAGAVAVAGNTIGNFWDSRFYPRYPHAVAPFSIDLNQQSKTMVDGLVRQHYFSKDAKVGLILFDLPGFSYAVDHSLIPALKQHGLELTDKVTIHYPNSYNEYGQMSSELSSAAVKFKTEGITHVMILDLRANNAIFFMTAAEKQEYRPRYGLTSQSGNSGLAEILGDDARAQLHSARSIGWTGPTDLRAADDPWQEGVSTRRRCISLMRKNGVEISSRNTEVIALLMCGSLWYTEAAVEAGGATISNDSLVAGARRLSSNYVSPLTFLVRMTNDVHGVGAIADMAFIDKCTCFRYTSDPYRVN